MLFISGCPYKAKLCELRIRPEFDGYGFTFETERNGWQFHSHRVDKVELNSPAESSGLQPDDRIVEANGVSVIKKPHFEAIKEMKTFHSRLTLLLVDQECEKVLQESAADPSKESINVAHSALFDRPLSITGKLCMLSQCRPMISMNSFLLL